MEYKVGDIRIEDEKVGIILRAEDDGFAIWITESEFTTMSDEEIGALIKQKIKERITFLNELKQKEEENKMKLDKYKDRINKLKTKKYKLSDVIE